LKIKYISVFILMWCIIPINSVQSISNNQLDIQNNDYIIDSYIEQIHFECLNETVLEHDMLIFQNGDSHLEINYASKIFENVSFFITMTNGNNRPINPAYYNLPIVGLFYIDSLDANRINAILLQFESFLHIDLIILSQENAKNGGFFYQVMGSIPQNFNQILNIYSHLDNKSQTKSRINNNSIYQESHLLYFQNQLHFEKLMNYTNDYINWKDMRNNLPITYQLNQIFNESNLFNAFNINQFTTSLLIIDYVHNFINIKENDVYTIKTTKWNTSFNSPISLLFEGISISGNIELQNIRSYRLFKDNLVNFQYLSFLFFGINENEMFDYDFYPKMQYKDSRGMLNLFQLKYQHGGNGIEEDSLGYIVPFGYSVISPSLFQSCSNISFSYIPLQHYNNINVIQTIVNESVNLVLTNNDNYSVYGSKILSFKQNGIYNSAPNNDVVDELISMGYNINDMFSKDDPRFFIVYDSDYNPITMYPQISSESYSMYSQEFVNVLLENNNYLETKFSYNITEYALQYNKSNSIFNPNNWILKPNQSVSIIINQNKIDFSSNYNFTDDIDMIVQKELYQSSRHFTFGAWINSNQFNKTNDHAGVFIWKDEYGLRVSNNDVIEVIARDDVFYDDIVGSFQYGEFMFNTNIDNYDIESTYKTQLHANMTWSAWITPKNLTYDAEDNSEEWEWSRIIAKTDFQSGYALGICHNDNFGDAFVAEVFVDGIRYNTEYYNPNGYDVNTKYHVAASFNGTTLNLYVNGILNASRNDISGIPSINNLPIKIGRIWNTNNEFNGIIEDVTIFDRYCHQSDIQQIMEYKYKHVSKNNYNINQWYHVVGVINNTNLSLYINGEMVNSRNDITYGCKLDNTLTIGSQDGVNFYNGSISNIFINYISMSSNDIYQIYNNQRVNPLQLYNTTDIGFINNTLYSKTDTEYIYYIRFASKDDNTWTLLKSNTINEYSKDIFMNGFMYNNTYNIQIINISNNTYSGVLYVNDFTSYTLFDSFLKNQFYQSEVIFLANSTLNIQIPCNNSYSKPFSYVIVNGITINSNEIQYFLSKKEESQVIMSSPSINLTTNVISYTIMQNNFINTNKINFGLQWYENKNDNKNLIYDSNNLSFFNYQINFDNYLIPPPFCKLVNGIYRIPNMYDIYPSSLIISKEINQNKESVYINFNLEINGTGVSNILIQNYQSNPNIEIQKGSYYDSFDILMNNTNSNYTISLIENGEYIIKGGSMQYTHVYVYKIYFEDYFVYYYHDSKITYIRLIMGFISVTSIIIYKRRQYYAKL